jgi:uncharacterized protein with von Willebrand factor type A (vWA) domain
MKSRRKFLLSGVFGLTTFALLKRFWPSAIVARTSQKARFLTEDGKLVEVDIDRLPRQRTKISIQGIKNWVWKKEQF